MTSNEWQVEEKISWMNSWENMGVETCCLNFAQNPATDFTDEHGFFEPISENP